MQSRYGELLVAIRDAEERVRFLGYDPANIKLVAFVVAAVMAEHRRGAVRPDRRHHLARRRRRRAVDRVPDRGGARRPGLAARAGARRDRRGVGADAVLRDASRRAGPTSRACCSSSSSASSRPAWPGWARWSRRAPQAQSRRRRRADRPGSDPSREGGRHRHDASRTPEARWPAATSAWAPSTSRSAT